MSRINFVNVQLDLTTISFHSRITLCKMDHIQSPWRSCTKFKYSTGQGGIKYGVDTLKLMYFSQGFACCTRHGQKKEGRLLRSPYGSA